MTQAQDLKLADIPWHLDDMNVPALWEKLGHRGKGVRIGIVDCDFYRGHPDFAGADIHYLGVAREGIFQQEPEGVPVCGHGTTVLSAAMQVAPEASFYLASMGCGATHDIVAALREVAQHVDVINLSIGHPLSHEGTSFYSRFEDENNLSSIFSTSLSDAIHDLTSEGKTIVVSGGNQGLPLFLRGKDNIFGLKGFVHGGIWPENSPVYDNYTTAQNGDTIVVGAYTIDHKLAYYSNWGYGKYSETGQNSGRIEGGITVTAPGGDGWHPESENISFAVHPEVCNGLLHRASFGTSLTAPFVTAVTAVVGQEYQKATGHGLKKNDVEDLLIASADRDKLNPVPEDFLRNTNYQGLDGRFDENGRSHFFGYGAINALKFWEKAMEGAQQVVSEKKPQELEKISQAQHGPKREGSVSR